MLFRLLLAGVLLGGSSVFAADFRIETKVFMADELVPLSQNTTLFHQGVIYDFAESPKRVAIFRHAGPATGGQFLLLDPQRNLRTEIPTSRIDTALNKLQTWASQQRHPLLKFAAQPEFEELYDEETGLLTLTATQMTYSVATTPIEDPAATRDLQNYLDWYAKLNCLLSPSMPPMPRLELNKSLARRKLAPTEVTLVLAGDTENKLRAEHLITWRLSKDDRARIALVADQLIEFQEVSNEVFQAGGEQTASK